MMDNSCLLSTYHFYIAHSLHYDITLVTPTNAQLYNLHSSLYKHYSLRNKRGRQEILDNVWQPTFPEFTPLLRGMGRLSLSPFWFGESVCFLSDWAI